MSKVDRQEVDNALNQAAKEIHQRYDFKNVGASIEWSGESIVMKANSEERVKAILDVFQSKLVKRGISLKSLEAGEAKPSGKEFVLTATITEGISQENAKKVGKLIRDEGPQQHQGPGRRRRAAGLLEEPRRSPGGHRPGQGRGPGLRRSVRQLPLNDTSCVDSHASPTTGCRLTVPVHVGVGDHLLGRRSTPLGQVLSRVCVPN